MIICIYNRFIKRKIYCRKICYPIHLTDNRKIKMRGFYITVHYLEVQIQLLNHRKKYPCHRKENIPLKFLYLKDTFSTSIIVLGRRLQNNKLISYLTFILPDNKVSYNILLLK